MKTKLNNRQKMFLKMALVLTAVNAFYCVLEVSHMTKQKEENLIALTAEIYCTGGQRYISDQVLVHKNQFVVTAANVVNLDNGIVNSCSYMVSWKPSNEVNYAWPAD